jgi:hypothetical protein
MPRDETHDLTFTQADAVVKILESHPACRTARIAHRVFDSRQSALDAMYQFHVAYQHDHGTDYVYRLADVRDGVAARTRAPPSRLAGRSRAGWRRAPPPARRARGQSR